MAQSIAYALSAPYSTFSEANNVGIDQGTRIVYADSEGGVDKLFGDSKLTLPVYGTSTSPYQGDWYAFRLVSDSEANVLLCTITTEGVVSID